MWSIRKQEEKQRAPLFRDFLVAFYLSLMGSSTKIPGCPRKTSRAAGMWSLSSGPQRICRAPFVGSDDASTCFLSWPLQAHEHACRKAHACSPPPQLLSRRKFLNCHRKLMFCVIAKNLLLFIIVLCYCQSLRLGSLTCHFHQVVGPLLSGEECHICFVMLIIYCPGFACNSIP